MTTMAATGCGHHLGDTENGLPCTRDEPHEPGKGCVYEHGSFVDDPKRADGGHG